MNWRCNKIDVSTTYACAWLTKISSSQILDSGWIDAQILPQRLAYFLQLGCTIAFILQYEANPHIAVAVVIIYPLYRSADIGITLV